MDVWEYFAQREREFDEMSVDGRDVGFYEEAGSDGRRGRVIGHVYFNDEAYLEIQERVEIQGSSVHRTDYGYFFIVGGEEVWGYERDPTHEPAVHRHTFGHEERHEAESISFKRACELGWREVSLGAVVDE